MDAISLERIKLMHPKLRGEVLEIYTHINQKLFGKGLRLRLAYTLRTIAEQNELYALGRTKLFDASGKRQGIVTKAKGGQSLHNYGLACFSEDTRIFTKEGLKYFYELTDTDKVLTFKDEVLKYEKPNAIISNDYEGDMVHIKTRSVDLLVTPNHKMVVKKKQSYNKYTENWFFTDASNLNYSYKIPTAGNYTYKNNNYIPTFIKYHREINLDNTINWYKFMGYWLSEGSVAGSKNGIELTHSNRYCITISQVKDKNPEVWEDINNCLKELGVTYKYIGHHFIFSNKGLWEYLFKIGNSHTKYIPKEMFTADKEHLEALYYALIDGDGCYYDNGEGYYSVSKQLAEDVLQLAVLLGKSAVIYSRLRDANHIFPHGAIQKSPINLQWAVRTRTNTTQELRNGNSENKKIHNTYYKGLVYCVNTEAGAVVVERNGKVSIAGNCDIVILIDRNGDGVFESASWDTVLDWDKDGKADWMEVVAAFKERGWTWGGDWKFKDAPHFEKTFGHTWQTLEKLLKDGKVIKETINGKEYIFPQI